MNNNFTGILLLPTENDLLFLDISTILRIEARSNYCRLYFSDKRQPLTVARTLSWFEQQPMLSSFIRIHRGHIINPQHVKNYRHRSGLLLRNDELFAVARRRKSFLKEQLSQLITNTSPFPSRY